MIFFFIFLIFLLIFLVVNFFFSSNYFSFSKVSSFECGFDSVGLVQISFSIHFFLIMIIFVVFDMELVIFIGFIFMDLNGLMVFFILFFFIFLSFYLELFFGKLFWVI